MTRTFDFYRATNSRFADNIDKEDHYASYLKRIENIVNHQPKVDTSTTKQMKFLSKIKQTSKNHHSMQYLGKLNF